MMGTRKNPPQLVWFSFLLWFIISVCGYNQNSNSYLSNKAGWSPVHNSNLHKVSFSLTSSTVKPYCRCPQCDASPHIETKKTSNEIFRQFEKSMVEVTKFCFHLYKSLEKMHTGCHLGLSLCEGNTLVVNR
jgi:hypothetical protein